MFDDLNDDNKNGLKQELKKPVVEDIFSEIDNKVVKSDAKKNVVPLNLIQNIAKKDLEHDNKKNIKKILLLIVIFFGFIFLCFVGYKIFKIAFGKKVDNSIIQVEEKKDDILATSTTNSTKLEDDFEKEQKSDIIKTRDLDTDGDGLFDWEEEIWKTDLNKKDTDNDGLLDKDEIYIYKTDPINPDSDGDTYSDGDEIKAGYDPLGKGKL